ncbi:hypothetical protein C8Q70DRAFT_246191 [Cubamyces menziesii]|nr:hypothetical protein C8Q70DRAFT_246191 [Cubamyces menziesii]
MVTSPCLLSTQVSSLCVDSTRFLSLPSACTSCLSALNIVLVDPSADEMEAKHTPFSTIFLSRPQPTDHEAYIYLWSLEYIPRLFFVFYPAAPSPERPPVSLPDKVLHEVSRHAALASCHTTGNGWVYFPLASVVAILDALFTSIEYILVANGTAHSTRNEERSRRFVCSARLIVVVIRGHKCSLTASYSPHKPDFSSPSHPFAASDAVHTSASFPAGVPPTKPSTPQAVQDPFRMGLEQCVA